MTTTTTLMNHVTGVSAFCTHAGTLFNQLPHNTVFPIQTHTARVCTPDEDLNNCDALVTNQPNLWLGIRTADCLPLLLYDPTARVIGLAHCGWRGTAQGLPAATMARMIELGANPANTIADIGPHICPKCFEVGPEVAAQFPPQAIIHGFDKPHISLRTAVALQLPQVTFIDRPLCSLESPHYHSVRRQGPTPHRTFTLLRLT